MSSPITLRLSSLVLSTVFAGAVSIGLAGCNSDSSSGYHSRYGMRGDDYDSARTASERRGEINTRRSDIQDDGRINGTARSYEERKASREADEGNYDAARREAELRRERLNR
jgi:hypothetical protein